MSERNEPPDNFLLPVFAWNSAISPAETPGPPGVAAFQSSGPLSWQIPFSSCRSAKSDFSSSGCLRFSTLPGAGMTYAPLVHRRGAKCSLTRTSCKLGGNALILALSWLALGRPSTAAAHLCPGASLAQRQVVRSLGRGIRAWNFASVIDASAMGRSAAKVESPEPCSESCCNVRAPTSKAR